MQLQLLSLGRCCLVHLLCILVCRVLTRTVLNPALTQTVFNAACLYAVLSLVLSHSTLLVVLSVIPAASSYTVLVCTLCSHSHCVQGDRQWDPIERCTVRWSKQLFQDIYSTPAELHKQLTSSCRKYLDRLLGVDGGALKTW